MGTQERITDLESRVAFQEQMIDELNDVISKQDRILMDLVSAVKLLNVKLREADSSVSGSAAVDVPPPHY